MKSNKSDYIILKDATILVVEDNEDELDELGELFDIYFKRCFRAKNGKEGLEQFVKNRPDIVLTDLGMPILNGFDMAEKIREIDKKASIVLHTIYTDSNIFLKAIEHKISGYMIKPTNAILLLDMLLKEFSGILRNIEIKKEKMLMQAILEEFPDPIMVIDLNKNILFANNLLKRSKYWKDEPLAKCHKVLYGYNSSCDLLGYPCGNEIAKRTLQNVTQFREYTDKDNKKRYFSTKTVPIKDENAEVCALLKVIQDKTDDINREKELKYLASYDTLTKLPNRVLLMDRLEQAICRSDRNKTNFALLFVDLDEFKDINDIYGHFIGDALLQSVSYRMKTAIRKIDTIARFGGDEFVIILENITGTQNVISIAEDILLKLGNEFILDDGGIKVGISCSIGIDIYSSDSCCDKPKEIILQNADIAMYEAKKSGKNRFKFSNNQQI